LRFAVWTGVTRDTRPVSDTIEKVVPSSPALRGMVHIPGRVFRMGSDRHYPEEAPSHLVGVNEFWIDRTPVTNREFRKFVNATGHVTSAEIAPDAKDYPGALPHMLKACCDGRSIPHHQAF
jgi:formylglycine-generating enzyme required for sulfatase activity